MGLLGSRRPGGASLRCRRRRPNPGRLPPPPCDASTWTPLPDPAPILRDLLLVLTDSQRLPNLVPGRDKIAPCRARPLEGVQLGGDLGRVRAPRRRVSRECRRQPP